MNLFTLGCFSVSALMAQSAVVKDKQRRKESKFEAANCYNQRTKAGRASAVKSERNILGVLRANFVFFVT